MSSDDVEILDTLQTWLFTITEEKLINVVLDITNSSILKSTYYCNKFAASIYTAVDYRPMKIQLYAQLLHFINKENQSFFPLLKKYFLKECFSDYEKKKGRLFFLFNCFSLNLLDIEDIKYVFTHPNPPDTTVGHSFNSLYFFCWFAPELEELEPEFFEITRKWFMDAYRFKAFPDDLFYFAKNYKILKNNDWKKLRQMRSNNSSHCKMLEVIKDDDIEIFKIMQSDIGFEWEQKIQPSIFDIHWIISESPSMFDYAAYFGSVKIFKFIFLNYVQEDKKKDPRKYGLYLNDDNDNKIKNNFFLRFNNIIEREYGEEEEENIEKINPQKILNVVHFAIAGGNTEIVRLLHSYDFNFFGGINIAALFHRNEIFDWLVESLDIKIKSSLFGDYGPVINYAIKSFNIYIIDKLIKENYLKKKDNDEKFVILEFALRFCGIESIKYLIDKVDFDLMHKVYEQSILYSPIVDNKVELVKLLVSKEPRLINCRSGFEVAIWTAARYGRTEIVTFLKNQDGIYVGINKKSYKIDPYKCSKIPLGITTNVEEFAQIQAKRRLDILKSRNPVFIGIG